MGINGGVDISQLLNFAKTLEGFNDELIAFHEECAKEIAARLLTKVIKRTPVGDYRGDEYITKTGKTRRRNYKTVNFKTHTGKTVNFKAKVNGKVGGDLRRGWTGGVQQSASDFANSIVVSRFGDKYVIVIRNDVYYASYVEHGHTTRNRQGWVKGYKMLTVSVEEIQRDVDKILERKLNRFLKKMFEGSGMV